MAQVSTTISHFYEHGNTGTTEGVEVTCDRCGHSELSYGTGGDSLRRCGALLRENCPRGERNFYEVD